VSAEHESGERPRDRPALNTSDGRRLDRPDPHPISTEHGGQVVPAVDKTPPPAAAGRPEPPQEDVGADALRRARRAVRGPGRAGRGAERPPSGDPAANASADASANLAAGQPVDPAVPEPVGMGRRPRRRFRPRSDQRDDEWSGARPDRRDPQPLGSVVSGLLAERGWQKGLAESRVLADWPAMVGPQVAAQSTPVSLRAGELRVEASSTAWATQLRLLAPNLLARIAEQVGAGVVTSLSITGPAAPSWKHGPRVFRGRGPRDTYG
jgi:predicted nucleic acid-binding Zn ribbon protein